MKQFIIKGIIFTCLIFSIITFILVYYGGYVDYFYEKFTTPKAKSFILGDSRSLQGIQPAVIDNFFNNRFSSPILNYSFTIAQVSYGPLYSESIKRKLDNSGDNGLYILIVHPWILSTRESDDEEKGVFFEENKPPHNMKFVDLSPNFEYFFRNLGYFHFRSIFRKTSKLHKDGWLEESNLPKNKMILDNWTSNQIKMYSGYSKQWKKSTYRLKSLDSLINYLNPLGTVCLVRMPVCREILEIEENYWSNFDEDISHVAEKQDVQYFNFRKDTCVYNFYDGNHVDKFSGKEFTQALCDSIKLINRVKSDFNIKHEIGSLTIKNEL